MASKPSNPRKRRPQGGKVLDPEWRRERAKIASDAAHSIDRYIDSIVDRAPELTAEQKAKLAELVKPYLGVAAREDGGESAA